MPYSLRVTEETAIYKILLKASELSAAPCSSEL
jgi:predicted Ser/Thr protein kinase